MNTDLMEKDKLWQIIRGMSEVTEKIVEEKAKSFLQKGVSLEIVLACIQEISAERIREIYASVVG